MTGPEHYKEAERLLALVMTEHNSDNDVPAQQSPPDGIAPVAQVHATLALAAATALQQRGYSPMDLDRQVWKAVAAEGGAR